MRITSQFKFNRAEEKDWTGLRDEVMEQLFDRQVIKGIYREIEPLIKVNTEDESFMTTKRAEIYVMTREQVVAIWEKITELNMTQQDKKILYNILNN